MAATADLPRKQRLAATRGGGRGVSRPLAWALVLCCALACEQSDASRSDGYAPPSVTLTGVRVQHFRRSQLLTSGRAARLSYYRQTGEFTAWEGVLRLPGRGGGALPPTARAAPDVEVRAPVSQGHLGRHQAVASGGVVLRTTTGGLVAQTPTLAYDTSAQTARGTEGVEVDGPGYRARAQGFTFEFPSEHFVFEGAVQSRMRGAR